MATVTFSAADDVLYAYLAGEIDHDAAQGLRIQLDDALLTRSPRILVMDLGGVGFMDSSGIGHRADTGAAALCPDAGRQSAHPARAGTAPAGLTACKHPLHRAGRGSIRRGINESGKQRKDPI